jgi:hypothetical protein
MPQPPSGALTMLIHVFSGLWSATQNSATSPQAQAIADELKTYRKASEAAIAERLAKGRALGDLPKALSVEGFAKYLAGVMNGMSIQARDGASAEELRALAQTALAALPVERQKQGVSSKE